MTGLEQLRAATAPRLVPMEPIRAERGVVAYGYMPQEREYNPMGAVHGGVVTMLLDTAMGSAVQSILEAGASFTTVELKTSFVRPVTVDAGPLRVEGQVMHGGRRSALAEAKLVDAEGRLFAYATSTCMLFRADTLAA
ncbi:MAG: PaaI family thioesterase [Gaiellaceae bacterium]